MSRRSDRNCRISLAVCFAVAVLGTVLHGTRLDARYIDVCRGDWTLMGCPDNSRHPVIDSQELISNYPQSRAVGQRW